MPAVVGRSQAGRFGSFQIVQSSIHGYRAAAADAKLAKVDAEFGAQFGGAPPFAQLGVPTSVTTTEVPALWRAFRTVSEVRQRYARSSGSRASAGRRRAIRSQCSV